MTGFATNANEPLTAKSLGNVTAQVHQPAIPGDSNLSNKKQTIIGVSGAFGSFSEQAAEHYMRTSRKDERYRMEYLITVENVLTALDAGNIDVGVFPIENSVGGIVIEAIEAMSRHNFEILERFEIFIHHFLMVRPGTKPTDVHTIVSHIQALRQCGMYLRRRWPDTKIEEHADTAQAAEHLARGLLPPGTAVIASAKAADKYGLYPLDGRIQDVRDNNTHFMAVGRRD